MLVEILGEIDRVLAGERIGHEKDFMRAAGVADLRHLLHERLVDMRAPGRVEDHDVVALQPRRGFGSLGDRNRILSEDDRQGCDADLLAEHRELFLRRRTLHVERGHQHLVLVPLRQAFGDLGRSCGFARALEPDQHDRHGSRGVEIDRLRFRAQSLDQRIVDDLDHHLAGFDRLDDRSADRLGAGPVDKRAHDLERDVRLEQRPAHLAHRGVDVLLGEGAATGEFIQNAGELFGQALEHGSRSFDQAAKAMSG